MISAADPIILGEFEECSLCKTQQIYDSYSSKVVCPNCGSEGERCCFYQHYTFPTREAELVRVYENGQRTRVGPFETGGHKKGIFRVDPRRLDSLNRFPDVNRHRHLLKAVGEVIRIIGVLGYPTHMRDQALYFYLKAYKRFSKIPDIHAMVLVCVFIMLRDNDIPVRMEEFVPKVSEKSVKLVNTYLREYRVRLNYQTRPVNTKKLIVRYGQELGYPFKSIRAALQLFDWCKEKYIFGAQTSWVITAAILYIIGIEHALRKNNRMLSQRMLSEALGVTEVSCRKVAKLIKNIDFRTTRLSSR